MKYQYDITLSFAGEDREYVEELAELLKKNNVKVFYDRFEEANLWGKDLGIHFDKVYRKTSRYCIPFISKFYTEKIWTNHEFKTALARAIGQNEEYILPVRFDDTEIDGIRPTIAFIDLRKYSPEQFLQIILQKLKKTPSEPLAQKVQQIVDGILFMGFKNSYITSSFGIDNSSKHIEIEITNKLKGGNRYFNEPTFKLSIADDNNFDSFQLINPYVKTTYPVKLVYGEVLKIDYPVGDNLLDDWGNLNDGCEIYAVITTTVDEYFESNRKSKKQLVELLS